MTTKEFNQLVNIKKNLDYKKRTLWTAQVMQFTQFSIAKFIDDLTSLLAGKYNVVIHCFWEPGGHVSNSQHYKGLACDFHLESIEKECSSYKDKIDTITMILKELDLEDKVGFGIYPNSNSKFFHIDFRGRRGRWGGLYQKDGSLKQIGFDEAYEMTKELQS